MKPINLQNNEDKIPTSSNCVILESLGIDCSIIEEGNLGATVTNALEQMVYITDTLNINTYNVKCFGEDCSPKTFIEVFQMMSDAICELSPEEAVVVCNSCIVETDYCISEDVAATMEINKYLEVIAIRFCRLQGLVIGGLQRGVLLNEPRIQALENAELVEIPFNPVQAVCSLNPQTTDIVTLTKAFEKMMCAFSTFHGDASSIDSQLDLTCEIFPLGHVGEVYESNDYANILSQLWEATCLLRVDLVALKDNCCNISNPGKKCLGESFVIDFSRVENEVFLGVTGSLTAGYVEGDSIVTVTDINNVVYTEYVYVSNYVGSTITIAVPNTLDLTDTLVVDIEIITANPSLGNIPCSSIYTKTLYNVICANVSAEIVLFDQISFALAYQGTSPIEFIVELTDGVSTFVENVLFNSSGTSPVLFSNLIEETVYTLTVKAISPSEEEVFCQEKEYTTPEKPCNAIINLSIDGLV